MSAVLEEAAAHQSRCANCANCATPLAGKFCGACGQRGHLHKSLLHLGEEIVHGLLHFDAKGIRTLPMLVAYPGQLTRRYVDGQRTRFVSPLGLFLFMVFLMFFVASLTSSTDLKQVAGPKAHLDRQVAKAQRSIDQAQATLAQRKAQGKDTTSAEHELDNDRDALATLERAGQFVETKVGKVGAGEAPVNTGNKAIDGALNHAWQNKELTAYKLKSAGAKFSFLLVPISLPFIWLLFCRRRDLTMYDHAVFALYSLSFMLLLCALIFILTYAGAGEIVGWLVLVAPPAHLYRQLRGTYALGVWSATWRTLALMFAALLVLLAYFVLILVMSVR